MKSFLRWLLQQTDRNDPVGDLARDAKQDRNRPRSSDVTTWRAYLEQKSACEGALRALDEAYRQWWSGSTAAGDGKLTKSTAADGGDVARGTRGVRIVLLRKSETTPCQICGTNGPLVVMDFGDGDCGQPCRACLRFALDQLEGPSE